LLITLYI